MKRKTTTRKNKKKNKKKQLNKEIIGIIIISFGILSLVSMYNNSTGYIGIFMKKRIFQLMGFGGYIVPYIILIIGILFLLNRFKFYSNKKTSSIITIFITYLILLDIYIFSNYSDLDFLSKVRVSSAFGMDGSGGGIIGSIFSYAFLKLFGVIGSYIILVSIILISCLLITNKSIVSVMKNISKFLMNTFKNSFEGIKNFILVERKDSKYESIIEPKDEDTNCENIEKEEENFNKKIKILDYTKNNNGSKNEKINSKKNDEVQVSMSEDFSQYKYPNLENLLNENISSNTDESEEIINKAERLEETLFNFGIDAEIIQISRGPTITRFEVQPAPGVKVSKILNLTDDIALGLAASGIRIEAPIPGKSAIGIEVPNINKADVFLKEVFKSDAYKQINTKLPFALGKDISGNPMVTDIAKMPHLLIAGATGSGKSVCINTLITSILFKSRPDEVKLLLIDPKVVELSVYNGIPHLLIPVVTDAKKAASALNWAVEEMTKRYNLFAKNNVRDFSSYNNKIDEKKDGDRLPQILIIIDELADLMMASPSEVEDSICRLAQMARAAGIHLVVATQRPSVDVITGTIKANIPSRISFAVSSQGDSRTILGMGGGEKLLGKGDMLFYPVGSPKPTRIQGAFISEKEVENIVEFLKSQHDTNYNNEVIEDIEKEVDLSNDDSDELLEDAIKLIVAEGQASISFLQRKLKIGYSRAARLIDDMEERGIVGGHEGSKPRKVLINEEDLM